MTPWQRLFLQHLEQLSRDPDYPVRVRERRSITRGYLPLLITIDTSELSGEEGGLRLESTETFVIYVPIDDRRPPDVIVQHDRFVGFPHVMHGRQLCIYLDPSREWNPTHDAFGFLSRLWEWLADAASGKFSAADSLYHAIGGAPSGSRTDTVIVVRGEVPTVPKLLYGVRRTAARIDLADSRTPADLPIVFWPSVGPMPLGAGDSLLELLYALVVAGSRASAGFRAGNPAAGRGSLARGFLTALLAQFARVEATGEAQHFLLAVPHPAGGPSQLIAGRLARNAVIALRSGQAELDQHSIEWCEVSDERDSVTTRRDVDTAASGFLGADVYLYGCGALGSWMAEFIVRAGANSIMVNDPGSILGGLLVRQNYTEGDIGRVKSSALTDRLRTIADLTEVTDAYSATSDAHAAALRNAHFIIDATANIAASQALHQALSIEQHAHAVLAQVATDPAHGTKGLLIVAGLGEVRPLAEIDQAAGAVVAVRPDLEEFHSFWAPRSIAHQITPTRGCSIPTFHGSAADLAAISGILVSTLARHRHSSLSGTHVFRLPTAHASGMEWIPIGPERDRSLDR